MNDYTPTYCECGLGPGFTCHPDCPAYKKPPPSEITGSVTVKNSVVQTREQPALKSSYTSVAFAAADTIVRSLLGQDDNRKRAVVWSTGLVVIGKRDQLSSGVALVNITGARLDAATGAIELTGQDDVWVIPTGVDAVVSVVNERWE